MNKKLYSLLLIPVTYSGFMIAKEPTLADALIVFALCALVGTSLYFENIFTKPHDNSERHKLEDELHTKRLKLQIEQVESNALHEKSVKDSRAAVNSYQNNKKLTF